MPTPSEQTVSVSAILPTYNAESLLPAALDALLSQTVPFDEIIIIDDGSTDNSFSMLQTYAQEYRQIRVIQHVANKGVCAALNTGLKAATGSFVMLCATDDYCASDVVALVKDIVSCYPEVGLICGDALVKRFDLKERFFRSLSYPINQFIDAKAFQVLSRKSYVGFNGGGSMCMNRSAVLSAGLLLPALKWHSDWLLYFVIACRHGIYYTNHVFVNIDIRKKGYAQGLHHKPEQNQVMLAITQALRLNYPDLWVVFKESALLPHYALRYVFLFMLSSSARSFLSTKLLWKVCINSALVVKVGRLFPYRIILNIRKCLRA